MNFSESHEIRVRLTREQDLDDMQDLGGVQNHLQEVLLPC